jgi:hypothetical protein
VPVVEVVPVLEDVPVIEDVPVVVHGKLSELGPSVVVGMVNRVLTPPTPNSVAPIGTPLRATVDAEPIVGDEADAAGAPEELPPITGQVPEAVPAIPPPSNTVVDAVVPPVELIVADDVPVIVPVVELPVPDKLPVLVDVPMAEVPRPNVQAGLVPVAEPAAADIIGLTPGDESSVAPKGIRVGGTGKAGPTPSGDVMPSGEVPGATCASAETQPKSTAAMVAITMRVIVG